MNDANYLYRYYPLYEVINLENEIDKSKDICSLLNHKRDEGINTSKTQPYRSLERIDLILGSKKIWFSKPESFNDPFEFLCYYDSSFLSGDEYFNNYCKSSEYKNETQKEWKNYWLEIAKNFNGLIPYRILEGKNKFFGICCFCNTAVNPLMWSHYANSHYGVCIRFKLHDKLKPIIQVDSRSMELIKYTGGPAMIFGKMDYPPAPVIINHQSYNYYKEEHSKIKSSDIDFSLEDLIQFDVMLGKHSCWSYEKEYRLIVLGLEGNLEISKIKYPNTDESILSVNAIIFGLKTPPLIKKLFQKSYGDSIAYFESSINHGKYMLTEKPLETSLL